MRPRRVDIVLSTPGIFAALPKPDPVGDGGGNPAFDNDAPRDMVGRLVTVFCVFTASRRHRFFRTFVIRVHHSRYLALVVARERPTDRQALQVELSGNNKQDLYAALNRHGAF